MPSSVCSFTALTTAIGALSPFTLTDLANAVAEGQDAEAFQIGHSILAGIANKLAFQLIGSDVQAFLAGVQWVGDQQVFQPSSEELFDQYLSEGMNTYGLCALYPLTLQDVQEEFDSLATQGDYYNPYYWILMNYTQIYNPRGVGAVLPEPPSPVVRR
jgi:hypothetical protein